jgi:glycosyltransferase involved in cell wall biosynthesis
MRVLLVASFVLPHAGGVEQFVASVRELLEREGAEVRVLACRPSAGASTADAVVPARYVGRSGWPLPVGGWRTLRRELEWADVVVANVALHALPVLSVLAARRRGRPALFVIHGSGQERDAGSFAFRVLRGAFLRVPARLAVRRSLPISVSQIGVGGVRRLYGVQARYLPYPLPDLPRAVGLPPFDGIVRVAWIGRLFPEKDPLLAVRAVERLRARRPATLDLYGDGTLRPQLEALASERPWLTLHGSRPWSEILAVQARAHVCLSSSGWDNVQVVVLEALSRGVPVVSTRTGDAARYYLLPSLERFCVAGDPDALGGAIAELAGSYDEWRSAFAQNGERLRAIHGEAARVLVELIATAVR